MPREIPDWLAVGCLSVCLEGAKEEVDHALLGVL